MPNEIISKTILNKTKRRDPWFLDDYTLNPFSGCSFNCLFCYIRGSKYGTHMERKLSIKANAVELLKKTLASRARKQQHGVIVLSSATDPYLQQEGETQITRQLLGVIAEQRFPVHLLTRSHRMLRDMDLLERIGREAILPDDLKGKVRSNAFITFSFSTLDDEVAAIFEPGATPPSQRLETLKEVASSGALTGVSLMPLLPWISDTAESLQRMFGAFKAAGAEYIFPSGITLFGHEAASSRTLVFRAVKKHYPHLLEKYESLFSQSDYLPAYYQRAFQQKAQALQREFSIRNSILSL